MNFLGFDVSSTGAGAVLLAKSGLVLNWWAWQEGDSSQSVRLRSLAEWAQYISTVESGREMVALSMEGPFLRGKGSLPLVRAQGAVMCQFMGDWEFHQPQAVKGTARRSAGLSVIPDKGQMIKAAKANWPRFPKEFLAADQFKAAGDVADAYWVAETDRQRTLKNLDMEQR